MHLHCNIGCLQKRKQFLQINIYFSIVSNVSPFFLFLFFFFSLLLTILPFKKICSLIYKDHINMSKLTKYAIIIMYKYFSVHFYITFLQNLMRHFNNFSMNINVIFFLFFFQIFACCCFYFSTKFPSPRITLYDTEFVYILLFPNMCNLKQYAPLLNFNIK